MDASLASAAASAVSGILMANAQANVAGNQARATAAIRAGNNEVAKSVDARNSVLTATQRWAQSVRNDRVYEAVGRNQEALAVNFNRARDARTRQNFAANIRQAEESGRQQAAAAASGITGSVVDVIDMTSKLRNGMQDRARIQAEDQVLHDYKQREFQQRAATLDSLDFTAILDNPSVMQSTQVMPTATTSPWSIALGTLANKDVMNSLSNFDFSFGTKAKADDGSYDRLETQRLMG